MCSIYQTISAEGEERRRGVLGGGWGLLLKISTLAFDVVACWVTKYIGISINTAVKCTYNVACYQRGRGPKSRLLQYAL